MPTHASPKKCIRRDRKRSSSHRSRRSALKTLSKKVLNPDNSVETKEALMRAVQKALDKAASKGTIHKNTAARKVSRLKTSLSSSAPAA